MRRAIGAALAIGLLLGAACGTDADGSADRSSTEAGADSETAYAAVSDVTSHAAIGKDFAAIKEELAAAKEGTPVDWDAVRATFTGGGNSKKGDGSTRTLATLLDAPDDVAFVEAAIAGGDSDGVRAQAVEKGITVLLARKVVQELDAARDKLADGNTDDDDGAPHNVDEAWAFYLADGNGPSSTAQKRAADFDLEGEVDEAVVAALAAAQRAARDGDEEAFEEAAADTTAALNYIFYLATYKYLDVQNDEVRRAEGKAFYRGIAPTLAEASRSSHEAIEAAFASGETAAGRAALNAKASLDALGIDASQVVTL